MLLSNTCKAAIKSVIYLASKHKIETNSTIKLIAKGVGENEHTIGKILQNLVKHKIINSIKGPLGGFYLNEHQINTTLIEIVEAIDGKYSLSKCGLSIKQCSALHPCPIHYEYKMASDILEKTLREKSVSDFSQKITEGITFLN
jgi:Rrf2 family protein